MAKLTPIKAIRAKCIDCMCGQIYEVRRCPCPECPLYEYRMGRRPKGDIDVYPTVGDDEDVGVGLGFQSENDAE